MMQMIKKYWAYILLAFSIVLLIYKKGIEKANSVYSVKTFKTNTGWGYDVLVKDTVFIHQENIPGISGNNGFATKEDAEKVGNLVAHKMQITHTDLPQITIQELDSLKITK